MTTMSHPIFDREVNLPNSLVSYRTSANSMFGNSLSPLADCLTNDAKIPSADVESIWPLFSNQGLEEFSSSSKFGHREKSKLEMLGLVEPQYPKSVLRTVNSNDSASIYDSALGFSKTSRSSSEARVGTPNKLEFVNDTENILVFSNQNQIIDYGLNDYSESAIPSERRCMTVTERIDVPSSDHVAEIVGKNGQRIKQLREQLKVWVKTPSRDEPPVFEITGLPEKIAEAKRIIQQMSDHFTKVQQERLARVEPNRVEDRLYVEQDKVGLIVGASGQTIRWVQQLSDTHIATPRKQESIPGLPPPQTYFTICGAKEKVKFAKQLICEYVTLRCQGLWLDQALESSPEASQLVRDFHQRRQVADTQRRTVSSTATPTTVPASTSGVLHLPSISLAQGRPLVSTASLMQTQINAAGDSNHPINRPSHLAELKSLWSQSATTTTDQEKQELEQQLPAATSVCENSVWNHVMFGNIGLGLASDRRYSADTPTSPGLQPLFSTTQSSETGQLKKSFSDDLVVPSSGWM